MRVSQYKLSIILLVAGNELVQYDPKTEDFNVEDWLSAQIPATSNPPIGIKQEAKDSDEKDFTLETPLLSPMMEDID